MRPVRRGISPIPSDFGNYKDAQLYLISRLGSYCSYCERRIATLLAVEHIQPKDLPAYQHLVGRWDNYLLGCVNCNSTKKDKDVVLANVLLPDRDNTFVAFTYSPDGQITPTTTYSTDLQSKAKTTLSLTGLDKKISVAEDENGRQVAIDRVAQRMEVWAVAEESRAEVLACPGNEAVRRLTVKAALGFGFFSIWMTVFAADTDMCNRFIDAFPGTRASACFHPTTTLPVTPAPNPDALPDGGKL